MNTKFGRTLKNPPVRHRG